MLFILDTDYNNELGVIKLTHTTWNDWFTYETEFVVEYIRNLNDTVRLGTIKIAHENMDRVPNIPDRFEELDDSYYSLGTDSMFYEILLKIFPKDWDRMVILESLKDVACNRDRLNRVRDKEPFKVSLSRGLSLHQIEVKFHKLANGDSQKTNYSFVYKYADDDSTKEIEIKVNDKSTRLPTNVHAIIGRNGVGKSKLIGRFLKCLEYNKTDKIKISDGRSKYIGKLDSFFNKIISVNFSIFDEKLDITENYNVIDGLPYICITKDSTLEGYYITKFGDQYEDKYIKILEKLEFTNDQGKRIKLDRLDDKWVGIFMESLITCFQRKPYLWTTILETLNTDPIFKQHNCKRLYDTFIEFKDNENEYLKQFFNFFTKLSSGHKIVILSLTKIIEFVDEKVLVVIDEPELYLHPPLLSSYIRCLSILMEKRNGVAILATHSPVVLQELANSCIYKLERTGNILRASRPDVETFAQNISTLMYEIFGLESEKSGFVKLIDDYISAEAHNIDTVNEAYEQFDNQLGTLGMRLLTTKLFNEWREN